MVSIFDIYSLSIVESITIYSGEKGYGIIKVILEFEFFLVESLIVGWGRVKVCIGCIGLWNIFIAM